MGETISISKKELKSLIETAIVTSLDVTIEIFPEKYFVVRFPHSVLESVRINQKDLINVHKWLAARGYIFQSMEIAIDMEIRCVEWGFNYEAVVEQSTWF